MKNKPKQTLVNLAKLEWILASLYRGSASWQRLQKKKYRK